MGTRPAPISGNFCGCPIVGQFSKIDLLCRDMNLDLRAEAALYYLVGAGFPRPSMYQIRQFNEPMNPCTNSRHLGNRRTQR